MLHHALLEGGVSSGIDGEVAKGTPGPVRRWRPSATFRTMPVQTASQAPEQSSSGSSVLREVPAVSVALLMGAINSVSYGTLTFASPVTDKVPCGIFIWLLSTLGSQLGTLLASNIRNGISCPMLEMIPIFHAMFLTIASRMPSADPEEVQATCLASCFVCTVTIGLGLLICTRLGLAKYLRAVPLIVLKAPCSAWLCS
ncbi:unnamed protein product [Effrenium voratum]|uniref:Uncharacterized protein n=1 Tax=Effrenium voratum TaxID=2562239 RepID=A0AA36J558_9DINO|nr:unnamed protein product [Effrenium voratum]CAJ1412569.1 unnamed protein product [Effrenium voratum]